VFAAEKKIPLYHIEDDEDWQSIIEDIADHSTSLVYTPIEGSIRQIVTRLKSISGPGIAIFDLRLEGVQSEFRTIVELSNLAEIFSRRNIDLIVLSGYLPEFGRPNLLRYGVPEDRIFNKGNEFNAKRENFIRLLKDSEVRLKGLPSTTNGNHAYRAPICEIEAQLDAHTDGKQLFLDTDKEYQLKVLAKTLDSEISLDVIGKELKVFIFGDSFIASPQNFTLTVSKPGETSFSISKIQINPSTPTDIQRLLILIYHNNYLIQQLAFDCQIQ
jgi:hypothetical protein